MSDRNEKKSEEMRLLFKIYIEDLRYCKKQQWYMLYLMLIGIGALAGIGINIHDRLKLLILIIFLIILCWGIFFIGWWFLYMYLDSIKDFRKKKQKIAENFEPEVKLISGIPLEDEGSDDRDMNITTIFVFIGFMAAFIATGVIWCVGKN